MVNGHQFEKQGETIRDNLTDEAQLAGVLGNESLVRPLRKAQKGHQSLGGSLDYSGWSDRERFIELDGAIQARAEEDWATSTLATKSDPHTTVLELKADLKEEHRPKNKPGFLAKNARKQHAPSRVDLPLSSNDGEYLSPPLRRL